MRILTTIIKGISYGFFPDGFNEMQGLAILLNYGLICLCRHRYEPPILIWKSLSVVLFLTLSSYFLDARLMGMSTVWSFLYGYTDKRNSLDNLGFCIICLGVFVPYYLKLWPWSPLYLWVCNMAHIFSAFVGFQIGNFDRKLALKNQSISNNKNVQFSAKNDLNDFEFKLLNGKLARKSAEIGNHSILNFDDHQCSSNKLIIGKKYHQVWNCDKPDPELHILKKFWYKLGLNEFVHEERFQKINDRQIIVNDCLKWHPSKHDASNQPHYKSTADRTYSVTLNDSKLNFDFQPWNINMTGLSRLFRPHAEKHMQTVLPKKSQIVFDSISELD